MKYVIIGNSAAAIAAVEAIRKYDADGSITIVSDEKYHTYSRPLISYLIYGKTDMQKMKYRPDNFYAKNNVKTLFGKKAVKIDGKNQQVILEDKSKLEYDKLLIATGSRPFVPPMENMDKVKNCFTFMSLDDSINVQKCLTYDTKTLIIGAGLIGLKAAEGICDKVKSITVVDMADRILPSILDEEASAIMQKHIEEKGVKFILNNSVSTFSENEATLADGQKIPFDIVIVAVGVRPNVELIKNAGGNVNKGILTDVYQETSLKNIYAAGDCTESYDITCDQNRILALLPNAYMQGEVAGTNMAGGGKAYENAIPMNAIGFFGLHIITAGSYTGEATVIKDEGNYKKLCSSDGLLKGYILMGNVERAGIYTSLIKERVPLSDIDFESIVKKPQLMAFSRTRRKEKLSGGISK